MKIILKFSVLDPRLKKLSEDKMSEWRSWFDSRLDDAIEAASTQQHPDIERKRMPMICLFLIEFYQQSYKNDH